MQPNGLITLGAGKRVNLLHVVGVRHELYEFREQRTYADHAVGGGAEQWEQIEARHCLLRTVQGRIAISPPSR